MSYGDATDRSVLANHAYADDRYLAARQALYRWQSPRYDIPALVLDELACTSGIVVDIGCGNGRFLHAIRSHRPDLLAIGLDVSAGIMAGLEPPIVVADARSLPFADGSAAAVLAMHMLYHLADVEAGVSELHRVLRPGGVALVSTNSARDKVELDTLWEIAAGEVLGLERGPRRISLSEPFTLEEAPHLLGSVFGEVRVIELVGEIAVPDPEPVVAHFASYRAWAGHAGVPFDSTIAIIRRRLEEIIARDGAFRTVARGGVLVCR